MSSCPGKLARSGGERMVGSAGVERDGRSGVERDGRARSATTSSGAVPPAPHAAGEPGIKKLILPLERTLMQV